MGVAKFPILQLVYCKTIRPNLLSSLLIQGACGLHPEGTIGLFNRGLTTAKPSPAIEENPPGDHEDYWKKFNEIEGLGARLSLVVREIENIERKRNTLQQSSNQQEIKEGEGIESAKQPDNENEDEALASPTQVEISHPWPEWIELVDHLVQGNYFTARRSREDDDIDNDISGGAEDFKVLRGLRNACRRFGRERFDILRSLSPKDIQVIVGYRCPNLDGKVITSAKRLRAYVHLDEGDVCSTCNLRGSCDRAYIIPRRDDGACTIDVMRLLVTYARDPLFLSVEKKLHLRKMVKASVRKLLKQVVELSATSLDPNLPKPVFKELPRKVDQAQLPPRKKVGQDHIEMKKGDWLCPTIVIFWGSNFVLFRNCHSSHAIEFSHGHCLEYLLSLFEWFRYLLTAFDWIVGNFMNFAKNKKCLECDEMRPKGKLNPGEWECPGCNFVNYKRNMACYKCECNRPRDNFAGSSRYIGRGSDWDDDMRDFELSKYTEWKWKRPANTEDDDFDDA